mgnify:CR=1 FL=1
MTTENRIVLPQSVTPDNYQIELEPNFETFTFNGKVIIKASVNENTDSVTLNSAELEITAVSAISQGHNLEVSNISTDPNHETLTITLGDTIKKGESNLQLQISFVGELNDRLLGFYRSQYTDINGNEKYLAATQFESTDARRAFPCWDEPSTKATFDVSLVIPGEMKAVSNMPIASESPGRDDRKTIVFDTTPVMSTYLLAFTEKISLDASLLYTKLERTATNLETQLSGTFKTIVFAPGIQFNYTF